MNPRTTLPRPTDRLSLGAGLSVSPFCLGMIGDSAAVSAAFDAGVNFFFITADMHWPLYESLRRGLTDLLARGGGIRDQIVVAGTAYVTQPDFCEAPFEELLASTPGLERLDVLCIGGAYANDFYTRLPVFERHRRSRFCGAQAIASSFHDRPTALTALTHNLIDLALIRYNGVHSGAERDLFPLLPPTRATRLFNFKSTYGCLSDDWWARLMPDATWRPHVTDYYRYALSRPELDGVLFSLTHASQMPGVVAALERGPLGEPEQAVIRLAGQRTAGWRNPSP